MYTGAGGGVNDAKVGVGDNSIVKGDLVGAMQGMDQAWLVPALMMAGKVASAGVGSARRFVERTKAYQAYREKWNAGKQSLLEKGKSTFKGAWENLRGKTVGGAALAEETGALASDAEVTSNFNNAMKRFKVGRHGAESAQTVFGAAESELGAVRSVGKTAQVGEQIAASLATGAGGNMAKGALNITKGAVGKLAVPVAIGITAYSTVEDSQKLSRAYSGVAKDAAYAAKQGEVIGKGVGELGGGLALATAAGAVVTPALASAVTALAVGGAVATGPLWITAAVGLGVGMGAYYVGSHYGKEIGGMVGHLIGGGVGAVAYEKTDKAIQTAEKTKLDSKAVAESWSKAREGSGLPHVNSDSKIPGLAGDALTLKNFGNSMAPETTAAEIANVPEVSKKPLSLKRGVMVAGVGGNKDSLVR